MAEIEKTNKGKAASPYDHYLHRGKGRGFTKTGGGIAGTVVVLLVMVAAIWRGWCGPGAHG